MYEPIKIPSGKIGDYSIDHFSVNVDQAKLHNLRCAMNRNTRFIDPGEYTRLIRGNETIMSDTPAEMRENKWPVWKAQELARTGLDVYCLVMGLGIGWVAQQLLKIDKVKLVRVIEISQEVIDLVAPHIKDSRFEVVKADALEYMPEKDFYWSVVWHDIWDSICGDNKPQYKKLHRRWGKHCYWQGSWNKAYVYDRSDYCY